MYGTARLIPLKGKKGTGLFAIVSRGDFARVSHLTWRVSNTKINTLYAQANIRRSDGSWTTVWMHKLILQGSPEVDHKNGNGLDNRRNNLRRASKTANKQNRFLQKNDHERACGLERRGERRVENDFGLCHQAACNLPYVPLSATSDFTAYTADGFDSTDQHVLRDLALFLKESGAHVILSNSTAARALYTDPLFAIREVKRGGGINSDTTKRGAVTELLIR